MGCFGGGCGAPCLDGDSGWERCALLLDVVCGVLSVHILMCLRDCVYPLLPSPSR